ncbi:hypothetical protein EBQ74_13170 [bacterium]|nr:hypothetical protein [bacterium]
MERKLMGLVLLAVALVVPVTSSLAQDNNETEVSFERAMEIEIAAMEALARRGFRCCAADAGYEEHGDHCVEAVTNVGGEARALQVCKTFHPQCVSLGCAAH